MSEQEIEQEIQARIEFKFQEFLTALKNRVGYKYAKAFDMTQESNYRLEAFREISEMVGKEVGMPTPCNEMANRRKRIAKDKAVDKIMETLDFMGRDHNYQHKLQVIVREVENAQIW